MPTSSFENVIDPVNPYTEERKRRGMKYSEKLIMNEDRRISDQVRVPKRFKENL